MTTEQQLEEALHMLSFVAKRAREGNFGKGRKRRDVALADIDYWCAPYFKKDFVSKNLKSDLVVWFGERP
jgi:hypothetical protein